VKKIVLIVAASLAIVGCQNKKNPSSGIYNTDPSVTQVSAPTPVAYQPAPAPYQAQPVIYDSTPPQAYNAPAPQAMGGNYTVKKGDTLYSIAKSRYGNGNQYTKIVSANPGLDPAKLRVGQTITIPQ
jgi:nucleoid-associated protein YgaU